MHRQKHELEDIAKNAAVGAAGGLIGTAALWLANGAMEKWLPGSVAPMRVEPGPFLVHQGQRMLPAKVWPHIPDKAEKASAVGLSFCYGSIFGALYGAFRPRGGSSWLDGTILGLICWAAGYLGWLPAAGIMKPIWQQKPGQIFGPIVQHALYGAAAVGAYDLIKEHV